MIEMLIIAVFGIILFVFGFMFGKMDKEAKKVQKPLEIKYTQHNAKKWTACRRFSGDEYMHANPEVINEIVTADFADKFKDIIKDHITVEKDPFRYEVIYRVEMWID